MKRLRIGIKLPLFPNAGIYARDIAQKDLVEVADLLQSLSLFGIVDGRSFGIASWVVKLEDK